MKKKNRSLTPPSVNVGRRHRFVVAGVFVAASFLVYRAISIQVVDNGFLQSQGDARQIREVPLLATRGSIIDRNGEALAVSTPVSSVWVNPQEVNIRDARLNDVAKLLKTPPGQITSIIKHKKNTEFAYIKRGISPYDGEKVEAMDIDGVYVMREFRRYYPSIDVASHVVGFTDVDDQGQEGMELAFDDTLRARPGKQRVVKDRLGRTVRAIDLIKPAIAGKDVQLSIDQHIQYIAYRELLNAVQVNNAKSGSVVVLDVETSEVLALVNQPSFNPNDRSELISDRYRNRAVTDVVEPGSTIKPFTVAAALQRNLIKPSFSVDTSVGRLQVADAVVTDTHNNGVLDVAGILQKSSNIGAVKIAQKIPKEALWETFSDVGFGEVPRSGFPGETNGNLPFFGTWNSVSLATLSYGYGLAASPLQIAQAYAVLANGGTWRPVTFIKTEQAPEGRQVLRQEVAVDILRMLEAVVSTDGTAPLAAIPGYRVAGKTGTARKIGKTGYIDNRYVSLFAGVAPVSHPKFVVVVVLDDPANGDYYGGKVAAPVFAKVTNAALRIMNIPPDDLGNNRLWLAEARKDL